MNNVIREFDTIEGKIGLGVDYYKGEKGERGEPGPIGPKGEQGPRGYKGEQGIPGIQGPIGPAGPKGADGTVEFDKLTDDQKAQLKGEKGDKGDIGPRGLQGDKGDVGPRGPKGEQGLRGEQGEQGLKGDTGKQGPKGDIGATGPEGKQGIQGERGLQGVPGKDGKDGVDGLPGPEGKQGPKGEPGERGPKGDTGPRGERGVDGKDGLRGPEGKQGIQGPPGPEGPKGDKGQDGKDGLPGPKGEQGPQGLPGKNGKDGEQGPAGPQGEQGLPGKDGKNGEQGPQGIPGEKGADGKDGEPGAQGLKGDRGPEGPEGKPGKDGLPGEKGEKGDTGLTGPQGPAGLKGDTGEQGPQGLPGKDGAQGIPGEQGPRGEQGLPGNDGKDGAQGPKGDQGEPFKIYKIYKSLEEMNNDFATSSTVPTGGFVLINNEDVEQEDNAKLFVKNETKFDFIVDMSGATGIQGPKGDDGLPGAPGQKGEQGPAGEQGIQGVPGEKGEQGIPGEQGLQGIPGEQGPAGKDGTNGKDGIDGKDGLPGADGADGFSPIASVTETETGATITIQDKVGTTTAIIKNGKDGAKGDKGEPGNDGAPGERGPAGENGKNGVDGKDGAPGAKGDTGDSGVYRGTEQPVDESVKVWLDPNGSATENLATQQYVDDAIANIDIPDVTPIATTAIAGKVKPDGTTITITEDGTISSAGGGGSGWDLSDRITAGGTSGLILGYNSGKIVEGSGIAFGYYEGDTNLGFITAKSRSVAGGYAKNGLIRASDGLSNEAGGLIFGTARDNGTIDAFNTGVAFGSVTDYQEKMLARNSSVTMGRGSLKAIGDACLANGYAISGGKIEATGIGAHAEGYTDSVGSSILASGYGSHAEGKGTTASGYASHAEGFFTKATQLAQHSSGKYNIEDTGNTYVEIVGYGKSDTERDNIYTLDKLGNGSFKGKVSSTGADYAEYFEWEDGNPNSEDRVGYIVALDGEKIHKAQPGEEVIGIVSGTVGVLGDNYEWNWNGKYLTDKFGRVQYDMVEEFAENPETHEKMSLGFFPHPKLNPEYDDTQTYVNRANRPEWDAVGMMGKLFVRDDGTCKINNYATVGVDGVATYSAEKTNMRVINRVDENTIRVLLV